MAGRKSRDGLRKMYHRRYGAEDGEARFRAKHGDDDPDSPMDTAQGELRPKRFSSGEKAPRKGKPSKQEVTLVLATSLSFADKGLCWFYPPWQEDSLTDEEIGRLSRALATEVLDSPKLLAWAVKAQKASKHGELIAALVMIALPRLARHGVIPSGMTNGQQTEPTVPMEAGTAHGDHRDDRVGEVSPHSAVDGLTPLFSGSEEQGGLGEVSGSEDGQDSGIAGRSPFQPFGAPTEVREAAG